MPPAPTNAQQSTVPTPKPILTCQSCGHDLTSFITTPWIRTCPECGQKFDPEFLYEGNPGNTPEPNATPPPPRNLDSRSPDND
ncbi:MAG: hypothetical protein COB69_08445 [Phycisphaera sp.]|nr:MAG: hypothetical protein COB69_08445 [Phycisphaera sp.]